MSKYAIVLSVKNEQTLLQDNINYHLRRGASCIYVYFDGTTDNSKNCIINNFGLVISQDSVLPTDIIDPPAWISDILPRWEENMDVRKRVNSYHAALLAKKAGYNWLFSLDADELLYFDGETNISDILNTIDESVDQIYVRNLEAIPSKANSGHPFRENELFLNRFPITEIFYRYSTALFRRIIRHPASQAWFEYLFYQLRFGGNLPRLMRHPSTGEKIPAPYFLGYTNCKPGIRLSRFENFNFNVHKWKKFITSPKSIYFGNLLHYDLCNVEYFKAKFRQRQPKMLVKDFYFRYKLAMIAINESDEKCTEFFEKNITITDKLLISKLKKSGIIREVSEVKNFFLE